MDKNWLIKVKSNTTLYLDEDNIWGDEDPRSWACKCVDTLRRGSILYAYVYDEEDEQSGYILLTKNKKGGVCFMDLEQVLGWENWFTLLEDRRCQ